MKLYGIAARSSAWIHSRQLWATEEEARAAWPDWKASALKAGVAEGFFTYEVVEHEVDDATVRGLLE